MQKNVLLPTIIAFIGVATILVSIFLPYASATEEYAELLKESPNTIQSENVNMTNSDIINLSLIETIKIYYYEDIDIFYKYFVPSAVLSIALFSLINLIFVFKKKPIAIMIFNVLVLGMFNALNWDFKDRNAVAYYHTYHLGISIYIFYFAVATTFIGAILMLVNKAKEKRKKLWKLTTNNTK
jgi:hypothetical protein